MLALPDHRSLPRVANAKLPVMYERAKEALAQSASIDECAEWANKAEALASYAKQAEDDTLRKQCDRIQARAQRRMGELLKAIERPEQGGRPKKNGGGASPVSRASAARDAGLSRDQQKVAVRVANIPAKDFEQAVESDEPPTVTALAQMGKRPAAKPSPGLDLKGRDPREFSTSTEAQGLLRRLAEFADKTKPAVVARGAYPGERKRISANAKATIAWLEKLQAALKECVD